jgi:hypothetical protein
MNPIRFTRIASFIWNAITSYLVLALVFGFIMVMSAQYMGRETEFSLSLIDGLSYRSKPAAKPNPGVPANSASPNSGSEILENPSAAEPARNARAPQAQKSSQR